MSRHIFPPSDAGTDDLSPLYHDDTTCEQRWGDIVQKIEADLANNVDQDERSIVRRGGTAAVVTTPNHYFTVTSAPGTALHYKHVDRVAGSAYKMKFCEWIQYQKRNTASDAAQTKKYFERSVRILNSLVLKIIVTVVNSGKAEMVVAVHPNIITTENIMIHQSMEEGDAAHFIQTEHEESSRLDDDDSVSIKYRAMKALGIVAYELLMRGIGPPMLSFLPSTVTAPGGTTRLLLSVDEYSGNAESEVDARSRMKRSRASDQQGRIANAMIDAGVPYPLCRFVIDLLGGECSDGLLFRSDNAFHSFSDILADLRQMVGNPDAFIHLSVKDRWRLTFGEKLHGRDVERKMIKDAAARVTGATSNDALFEALALLIPQNKQQIVMCHGKPGSGKSRLVMEARKDLENQGWLFLSCKFERLIHAEPLSIMASAFDEFLEKRLEESRCLNIRTHLKQLKMDDISILIKHVPSLIKYLDDPPPTLDDFEANKVQIHQLFYQLLEALSLSGQPIAFFVDDLQWADAASLELFIALSKARASGLLCVDTKQKSKIMLIGSYRDNEVDGDHQLDKTIQQLKSSNSVEVTDISVCGFDRDTLSQIVSESLCLPLRRTNSLSEIILQKTDGIVIHMIEFIERLTIDRILTHSFVKGWEWDSEAIEGCPISESVAEMFTFKLKMLPTDVLRALQICTLFGIQMEKRIIDYVNDFDKDDSVDIYAGLDVALKMGLVEIAGTTHAFKFAHDIIAQATFDMISDEERSQLLQKLVSALIKNALAANELDSVIFVAVDLINRMTKGDVTDPKVRHLYAKMNDEAGKKALSVCDFLSALKYSESGLLYLGIDSLENQRELSLSLHQTSVLALYSCTDGNQDLLKERIKLVLQYAASLDEEFKTRYVWIRLLSTTSLQEAIDECHSLLERLGEFIDSSNDNVKLISNEVVRVKECFLKEKQLFSSLTRMVDPNKLRAMKIMTSLAVFYSYMRRITGGLVCARMVELSMKHGFCEDSVFGLASFASTLIAILGDIEEGCSCARMALTLVSKSRHDVNVLLPAVYLAVYSVVLVWEEPMQATLDQILHGCRLAFDYGNIQFAVSNTQLYVIRSFLSGKKIGVLLDEIEILAWKCARHGQLPFIQNLLTPIYNSLRDLNGLHQQALAPLEQYIDNDTLRCTLNKPDNLIFELQLLLGISHSFLFRNMEKAQGMSELFIRCTDTAVGLSLFNRIIFEFYAGLTACHLGRNTQEECWKNKVENVCNMIERCLSHSKWNFENKFLLLKAEYHYTKREANKAATCYEASIISARNHKLIHEEAMAYELAGYFYEEQGEKTKSEAYFLQAHRAYMKWGADKKAKALQQG